MPQVILGIETSCDETAAAVVVDGKEIVSSVVSSQVDLHSVYGGVVPELASRSHLELLLPVVDLAMKGDSPEANVSNRNILQHNISGIRIPKPDAVAVTNGPGLIGALLVGTCAAKALALAWDVPFVAVNHLEAHLYATFIDEPEIQLPLVVLLVSGGHTMLVLMKDHGTYEVLGETRDDAAGEAFDKTARALGLGYPGGPVIDKLSQKGDPKAIAFPRPMINTDDLDFSFSGLKTAVVNYLQANYPQINNPGNAGIHKSLNPADTNSPNLESVLSDTIQADIAASFQASLVDVLVSKSTLAIKTSGAKAICVAGGVSANSELRSRIQQVADSLGVACYLASGSMCTDNAAMVAAAGWWQLNRLGPSGLNASVNPSAGLGI